MVIQNFFYTFTPMKDKKYKSLKLEEAVHKRLKVYSSKKGEPMADIATEVIDKELKKNKS